MRILVTGGSGYIASTLVPLLKSAGHTVEIVDIKDPDATLGLIYKKLGVKVHRGDVADSAQCAKLLPGFDKIVHLAALVGYPACNANPTLAKRWNVETARNLVKYKTPGTGVVFSSTISNYGAQTSRVDENTPIQPNSVYGQTKKEAEDLFLSEKGNIVFRYAGAFGVATVMRHDNLVHDFTYNAVTQGKLSIYESHFIRQFIHVHDMASAIVFAMANWNRMGGQIFNVGNPAIEITKKDVVTTIARFHKFDYKFENSGTDAEKRNYPVSFDKICNLGFKPTRSLESAVEEIVHYYKMNPTSRELQHAAG